MLHGIIEDTQTEFEELIKMYAGARFKKHPKASDENHAKALPYFQSIGNKLDVDFNELYEKAELEIRLDRLEEILN